MGKNGTKAAAAAEMRSKSFYPPGDLSHFCVEFVVRELNGYDDFDIAAWIEAAGGTELTGNAALKLEAQEAIRRSIVSVDGVEVNVDSVPWKGMDKWSRRMMQFAGTAFNELNGVEASEIRKFKAGEYAPTTLAMREKGSPEARTGAPSGD